MTTPRIVVIGSSNTDMVVASAKLPAPGETVLGGTFYRAMGGKGANQAVAAARAGADVAFVGRVGQDDFGRAAVQALQEDGIDTQYIVVDEKQPSGVALILVDQDGENSISVAPGANGAVTPGDLEAARPVLAEADLVLLQLEIPQETVEAALRMDLLQKTRVLVNPAPAPSRPLAEDCWAGIELLTPNQGELAQLVRQDLPDHDAVINAARELIRRGVGAVVVTLGGEGALLVEADQSRHIPACPVTPVDTVGAGDCFSACLGVAVAEGADLPHAVRFAAAAAALATTRQGAQPSMPCRETLVHKLADTPAGEDA